MSRVYARPDGGRTADHEWKAKQFPGYTRLGAIQVLTRQYEDFLEYSGHLIKFP